MLRFTKVNLLPMQTEKGSIQRAWTWAGVVREKRHLRLRSCNILLVAAGVG